MKIKTFIVDSFTNIPFKGNPAGVCLLEESVDIEIMQSIATELNLSETAFLLKTKKNQFSIRYFTPTVEIDFCGHATLAASKIILDKLNNQTVDFTTYKGLQLNAKLENEYIKMLFPLYETTEYIPNQKLNDAFGLENIISTRFSKDLDMLIIEVKDKQTLLNIKPNYQKVVESSETIKEVVITSKSQDKDYDFYSRCFCPWIGINEDPVTGASHSVLAKYWSDILNKKEMSAFQVSDRGGSLKLKIISNTELEVRSNARIVLEGEMNI
ncbi:MAG: PhzF family phenazine biosynthesis protein [Eudoraea sp.]|jgi:PhzF family phenazine biosynthesis protein|uniref:PhzF family phenazine biosynthesis protein n=1 Tax=Eudoraea sp. TaxID=1979955 RepID=UPI003267F1DA